jgi:hypothetical protein
MNPIDLTQEFKTLYRSAVLRPAIKAPKKYFELALLRGATARTQSEALSTFTIVGEQTEDLFWRGGVSATRFSERFETFVGSEMPMGVGPHRTAMLMVGRRYLSDVWEVFSVYTDLRYPKLLWRQKNKPDWVKVENHGI